MIGIPRLRSLDELDPRLADYLAPTVARLGYLGELFQTLGHVPDAVVAFMEYTKAVKAPLSDRENELLALVVSAVLGADYERIQHERLALKLGLSRDWIAELTGRKVESPSQLNDQDRRLQELALAVVARHGKGVEEELRALVDEVGPQKAVAVLLQISRFVTIALLVNALQLRLPVPSIFEQAA